jgi:rSAM/selenodomain-associated transferase 2
VYRAARRVMPSITVIIPVYRDSVALARTLGATDWSGAEVIVVSAVGDETIAPVRDAHPDLAWLEATRGRARQMNVGAAAACSEWLLFLHADTRLPFGWRKAIDEADRRGDCAIGCFRFALDSSSWFARAIEVGVRVRVALLGLPYGDQALFVRRPRFCAAGGFAEMPIMEDVDFVRRMRRQGALFCSHLHATTSARRWEHDGWILRTVRHLALISLYFCGVSPDRLIRLDRARPSHPQSTGERMSL